MDVTDNRCVPYCCHCRHDLCFCGHTKRTQTHDALQTTVTWTPVRLIADAWKNGGSDPDAVWHYRSDGSRDEAGGGVWGSVHGKGYLWRIWGAPLQPMGTLRRQCATVPQLSELRFTVVHMVGRGIAVLDRGPRPPRARERCGVFVLHFHNGKCHWVTDGEMFPICMRKLHNISIWQTYCWIRRFVGFLAIYSLSRSKLAFMRN